MAKRLGASFDRIDRAEEHLKPIKCGLLRHYEADEYLITGEYQRYGSRIGGEFVTDPTMTPAIDVRLNTVIGEYLHDLRSALDHLAWQLVVENRGTPTDKTGFPIKDADPGTDKHGRPRTPNVSGGVSPRARALIRKAQPYTLGADYAEHALWLLHQLWNIDKHRYVIAKGSFHHAILPFQPPSFRFSTKFVSATPDGAKLLLVPDDPSVDVDAHMTVEIGIYEPDYGIEQPLLPALEAALDMTRRVVAEAEATCFS
ncbi:MAG: hypothetical protein KGJ43_00590 [Acidobacteriota bacterium]|nr:hypothetical protein [Acidobacteriota bacterium]